MNAFLECCFPKKEGEFQFNSDNKTDKKGLMDSFTKDNNFDSTNRNTTDFSKYLKHVDANQNSPFISNFPVVQSFPENKEKSTNSNYTQNQMNNLKKEDSQNINVNYSEGFNPYQSNNDEINVNNSNQNNVLLYSNNNVFNTNNISNNKGQTLTSEIEPDSNTNHLYINTSSNINNNNICQSIPINANNITHYSEQSTEIMLNQTITMEDIQQNQTLTITEKEGNQLKSIPLQINAAGYPESARKANDGVTLFGPRLKDEHNVVINDIEIASNLKDIYKHIFTIYYKKQVKKYYIRTYKEQLDNGLSVLLVKIKKTFPIKLKEIFMIGDLFFVFKVRTIENESQLTILKLSCKRSPEEEKYIFNSSDYLSDSAKPITIGRDKKCQIVYVNDKSFSKIHSSIIYNKNIKKWEIIDGTYEKNSTNGVWVIPKHSHEIYDGLTFKLMGYSKFVINVNNEIGRAHV